MLYTDKFVLHLASMGGTDIATHIHNHTERSKFDNQVRTTVAHERQCHAGDWQDADVHADIHDKVTHKVERDADTEKKFKIATSAKRNVEYAIKQKSVADEKQ